MAVIPVPPFRMFENDSGLVFPSNLSETLMDLMESNRQCQDVSTEPSDTFRMVVDVLIVGLLCLIGFVGNSLTFVILRGDRDKHSTTNWLLQTLAVVDIVYLVACLLIQPVKTIHDLYPETEWRPGSAWNTFQMTFTHMEPYVWPLASIAQTVTVWVVVLVTVDRYIAICLPLRSKIRTLPRARAAVAVVIVGAVLFNVPRFFEQKVWYKRNNCTGSYHIFLDPTELRNNKWYFPIYRTVCYFMFKTIGPLLLLIVLNGRLIRALRQMRRRHRYLTRRNQQRESVTMTLVVVVSVFIACELPDVALRIAVMLNELDPGITLDQHVVRNRVTPVNNALLTLNSAANFFIYCLIGNKFRRILFRMCCPGRYMVGGIPVGGGGGSSRRQGGFGRGSARSLRARAGAGGAGTVDEVGANDEYNGLFSGATTTQMSGTRMSMIAMTACHNTPAAVEPAAVTY